MEEELQNSLLLLKAAASEVNELSQFPVNNIENSDIGGQVNHLYEMRLLDRSSNAESKVRDLLTAREYFDDVKAANVRKTRKTLPPVGSVRADDILAGTA